MIATSHVFGPRKVVLIVREIGPRLFSGKSRFSKCHNLARLKGNIMTISHGNMTISTWKHDNINMEKFEYHIGHSQWMIRIQSKNQCLPPSHWLIPWKNPTRRAQIRAAVRRAFLTSAEYLGLGSRLDGRSDVEDVDAYIYICYIWVFPKMVGFSPKSSIKT